MQEPSKLRKRELIEKKAKAQETLKAKEEATMAPKLAGKAEYLYYVGAEDCIKMEQQWRHGFQLVKPKEDLKPRKARKQQSPRIKRLGNAPALA